MSQNLSEYERLRLRNIADNKRILAEIGLTDPLLEQLRLNKAAKPKVKKTAPKRKAEDDGEGRPRKVLVTEDVDSMGSILGDRRKSARIQGKAAATEDEVKEEVASWEEDEENRPIRVPKNRPNHYGIVEGVPVGTTWLTRMECCRDGIHRPTVAGIHGGPEGAYSIALSGGYDDNIDLGEGFTYTGEGGRDLKGTANNPKNLRTAPQSKDQSLSRGNLALCRSQETGQPVRVIRGYKLTSPFAPDEGYRYDGLYRVEKCWYCTGVSGFKVWKYALKRLADQAPPPWTYGEDEEDTVDHKDSLSEVGSYDSGCHVEDAESTASSQKSDQGLENTKTQGDDDGEENTPNSQESDQGVDDVITDHYQDNTEITTNTQKSDQGIENTKTQNDVEDEVSITSSQESDKGIENTKTQNNDGKENTASAHESMEDTLTQDGDGKESTPSYEESDQCIEDVKTQCQEDTESAINSKEPAQGIDIKNEEESTSNTQNTDENVENTQTNSQQSSEEVDIKADVEMEREKDESDVESKNEGSTESGVDDIDIQKSLESSNENNTKEKAGGEDGEKDE